MSKIEDFIVSEKPADGQTSQLLYEDVIARAANPAGGQQQSADGGGDYIRILETPPAQQGGGGGTVFAPSGAPSLAESLTGGAGGVRALAGQHATEYWPRPLSTGGTFPGPNGIQWNGNRPDQSRGPGGTVFQPRPGAWQNKEAQQDNIPIVRPPDGPQVAPITRDIPPVDVPRDPQGRPIGPVIIPDHTYRPAQPEATQRPPQLRPDGTVVDPKAEKDYGMAQLSLMGALAGCIIGMAKGKGGMLAGAVAGLLVGPIVKAIDK